MITTITGNNQYLKAKKLFKIKTEFIEKYGDLAIEKIDCDNSEYKTIKESMENLPFLVEMKLVILRDPSKNKELSEKFEQIISTIPDVTEVVIVEQKVDKRTAFFKIIKTKSEYLELNEQSEQELVGWIIAYVNENGGDISRKDAVYLVDRAGVDQEKLSNELDKLLAYKKTVDRESINELTEPNPKTTVFDLLDSAFNGHGQKAMSIYDEQRRQKVEPQAIMGLIGWQLHVISLISTARGKPVNEIARDAKLNPYVVNKSSTIAKKLSLTQVKKLVNQAVKLDLRLKTKTIDADEAMKHFLLSLSF